MNDNQKLNISLVLYAIALTIIVTFVSSYSSKFLASIVMAIWSIILVASFVANSLKSKFQSYLYIASVVCSVAFLLAYLSSWYSALNVASVLLYALPFVVFMLIALFFIQFYLIEKTTSRWLFLALAILAAIVYFALYMHNYLVSDETVLTYYAYHSTLTGGDPYCMNVAANLTHLHLTEGIVITYYKNLTVVSNFKYPALYLLVQAPFYYLLHPTPYNLDGGLSVAEAIVFFLIFIVAYLSISKNRPALSNPTYAAVVLFALLGLTQLIFLLMIALVLFMYSDFGKRHKWLILGLMISMQEQLWAVALLFLVYELQADFNKGIRTALGAGAVFLLVNGYFIAINPSAFLNAFFTEASGLQPNVTGAFSHILLEFGASSSLVSILFIASIIAGILLTLRLKDYRIIPLISVIPFLFFDHSGASYFIVPFVAFAFIENLNKSG